jgi:hypothetical protein
MHRRRFMTALLSLLGMTSLTQAEGVPPTDRLIPVPEPHEHRWVQGPFLIWAAYRLEDTGMPPTPQPGHALLPVEHCTGCGLLRLDAAYREQTGKVLGEERVPR